MKVLFLHVEWAARPAMTAVALFLAGQLAGVTALFLSGDLLIASLWFYWLAS